MRLSVFFAVIGSLQLFDLIMPLTGGGPGNSTHTMVTYLYQFGVVRLQIGFGSAVGVVLFLISVTLAFTYSGSSCAMTDISPPNHQPAVASNGAQGLHLRLADHRHGHRHRARSLMTALGGFKTLGELRTNAFGLPQEWQWSNYVDILLSHRYWLQMWNSMVIAVLTVFLTLAAGAMAAFVFAHVQFFGSRYLLNYFLLGLMFPAATAILPLFIRIRDMGLIDTYWAVVLPQVAFGLASRSCCCATTSAACRASCSTPPSSTAAATSASSGASPCRSRARSWRRSASSRS